MHAPMNPESWNINESWIVAGNWLVKWGAHPAIAIGFQK
jgi:hypothetical protein